MLTPRRRSPNTPTSTSLPPATYRPIQINPSTMILRPDTRAMLVRRVVRAPRSCHTPIMPLSVRVMVSSQRAVTSSGKSGNKNPLPGKASKEIPIIGSDDKSLFGSLGITGRLKMVAIAIFAVLATIESMFWASMLWNKYGQGEEE